MRTSTAGAATIYLIVFVSLLLTFTVIISSPEEITVVDLRPKSFPTIEWDQCQNLAKKGWEDEYAYFLLLKNRLDSSYFVKTNMNGIFRNERVVSPESFYLENGIVKSLQRLTTIALSEHFESMIEEEGIVLIEWFIGKGGWGDRVKTYATALLISVILNRRLVLRPVETVPFADYFEPNCYDWREGVAEKIRPSIIFNTTAEFQWIPENSTAKQYIEDLRKYPVIQYGNLWAGEVLLRILDHPATKTMLKRFAPSYYISKEEYITYVGAAFRFLFKPKANLKLELGNILKGERYLSMHIRMGGEQIKDPELLKQEDLYRFPLCANIVDKWMGYDFKWYVAADSVNITNAIEEYGIKNNKTVVYSNGTIIHSGHKSKGKQITAEGFHRTIIDWWVLVNTPLSIVRPWSGFSLTACSVGGKLPISVDLEFYTDFLVNVFQPLAGPQFWCKNNGSVY